MHLGDAYDLLINIGPPRAGLNRQKGSILGVRVEAKEEGES
jgi:hypothetical protein